LLYGYAGSFCTGSEKQFFLIYIPTKVLCEKASVFEAISCYNAFIREIISKIFLRNL